MITSVQEMFVDEGSDDDDGYSFAITWLVKTDSHATGTYEVLNAPGIPVKGEKHRSGRAIVKSRQARKHLDSDLLWNVTANYEPIPDTPPPTGGGGNDPNNVNTTRLPTLQITGERVTKYSDFDYLGFLIKNSAGDQYEGMDEYDGSDMILTIGASIDFRLINEGILAEWRDVVHGPQFFPAFHKNLDEAMAKGANAPRFFGFPAFTPRFLDWSTASQQENNNTRWQVNLRFAISDTWLRSRLDEGFYTNPGGGEGNPSENINPNTASERKRALDASGLPSVVPVKLDGKGEKTTGAAFYRFYQRYKHGDLNAFLGLLGLPTTVAGYEFRGRA